MSRLKQERTNARKILLERGVISKGIYNRDPKITAASIILDKLTDAGLSENELISRMKRYGAGVSRLNEILNDFEVIGIIQRRDGAIFYSEDLAAIELGW